MKQFIDNAGLSIPVLLDSDGEFATRMRVQNIPTVAIIGRDGMIASILVGSSKNQLEEAIKAALQNEVFAD